MQLANAATAIAAVHALGDRLSILPAAIESGVRTMRISGRLQQIASHPQVVVDVGHNPQAARALAQWLANQPPISTVAVFSALADKDIAAIVAPLSPHVMHWWTAGLDTETARGLDGASMHARLRATGVDSSVAPSIAAAVAAACASVGPEGRVLVFGSFYTVAAALRAYGIETLSTS